MKWWSYHWELSPLDSSWAVSKNQVGRRKRHVSWNSELKQGFDFAISLQYTNRLCERISKMQINSIIFRCYISFQLILLPLWGKSCPSAHSSYTTYSGLPLPCSICRGGPDPQAIQFFLERLVTWTFEIRSLTFCNQDATAEAKTLHIFILCHF